MVSSKKLISIGIPARNEELNIPELIKRLEPVLQIVDSMGFSVEILVNDNASSDSTAKLLADWTLINPAVKVIQLPFLISYQETIMKLLERSRGEAFILLQSDLQDPPELIPTLIEAWSKGSRVVVGVVSQRKEGLLERAVRGIFYGIIKLFSDAPIIKGVQDFYILDRIVVDNLTQLPRIGLFLRGHITSNYGEIERVYYLRDARTQGESKFDFATKYTLALDGILLFGTRFIRFISVTSFLFFCMGILGSVAILTMFAIGFRPSLPGWGSLALLSLILISLLGMTTGLILEYLIRIYRFQILSGLRKR